MKLIKYDHSSGYVNDALMLCTFEMDASQNVPARCNFLKSYMPEHNNAYFPQFISLVQTIPRSKRLP